MNNPDSLECARAAVARIQKAFPAIQMHEAASQPVELSCTIPVQPGVRHEIWLGLQNGDELHFSVGKFWMDWFPCTEIAKADEFVRAVSSYLSGDSRVREHYRGAVCVKAELQQRKGSDWQTVATWSRLWIPLPWKKTYRALCSV